jgi:hypothetical protein
LRTRERIEPEIPFFALGQKRGALKNLHLPPPSAVPLGR